MNSKLFLLALLLLSALFLLTWYWLKEEPSTPLLLDMQNDLASENEAEALPPMDHPFRDDIEAATSPEQGKEDIAPEMTVFSGRVIDIVTATPIDRFSMHMEKVVTNLKELPSEQGFHDPEGRFTVQLSKSGKYKIRVNAQGYMEWLNQNLEIPEDQGLTGYIISLDPGYSLSGRVVSHATGEGVHGVKVEASSVGMPGNLEIRSRPFFRQSGKTTATDSDGCFTVTGLQNMLHSVEAYHPDHGRCTELAKAGKKDIILRLGCCYQIYGTVLDDFGRPLEGIAISCEHDNRKKEINTFIVSSSDGRYVLRSILPGRILVTASDSGLYNFGKTAAFTEENRWIKVLDRDVEVNFGPKARHVTWRGTFYGWQGKGAARGRMRVLLDDEWSTMIAVTKYDEKILRDVTCDTNGRFEIRKLVPGRYKVYLSPTGAPISYKNTPTEYVKFKEPGQYDQDIFFRNTELSGVVRLEGGAQITDDSFFMIMASKSGRSLHFSQDLDRTGRFRFRGIPPGSYTLSVRGKDIAGTKTKVTLADRQVIDDIEIIVPHYGKLRCKVTGLEGYDVTYFNRYILTSNSQPMWSIFTPNKVMNGVWDWSMTHQVGSWRLVLENPNLGKVERAYEIFWNQTTDILIYVSEFKNERSHRK